MEQNEFVEALIAKQKLSSLMFDFHRVVEKRNWDGATHFFTDETLLKKAISIFGDSSTSHRFVTPDSKVQLLSNTEAEYEATQAPTNSMKGFEVSARLESCRMEWFRPQMGQPGVRYA